MKNALIFTLLLSSLAAFAQPKTTSDAEALEKKKEKIEAMKVAYLTNELELTVEESQAFWPVYNELQDKEIELRSDQLRTFKGLGDNEMSDEDIEKMIYSIADAGINIAKLRKSYLDDFIEVIGSNKTAKFMRAEKEFGRRMMARMKGSKGPQHRGEKIGKHPIR